MHFITISIKIKNLLNFENKNSGADRMFVFKFFQTKFVNIKVNLKFYILMYCVIRMLYSLTFIFVRFIERKFSSI